MKALAVIFAILASLILAAHFLHAWILPLVAFFVLLPLVLLIRKNWAVRFVQVMFMLGALEWLRTMLALLSERQAEGREWMRMVIILGGVELFTVLSAVLLQSLLRSHVAVEDQPTQAKP